MSEHITTETEVEVGDCIRERRHCPGFGYEYELAAKQAKIDQLREAQHTDAKLVEVYKALASANEKQDAHIAALKDCLHELDKRLVEAGLVASNGITALNGAVAQLRHDVASITRIIVPNGAVCPGWGDVSVVPHPFGAQDGGKAR